MIEDPVYEDFWQRDFEESIRQGSAKPFVEEAILQVSHWGFNLADLKLQKKERGKGILNWLKWLVSLLREKEEEFTGFLGPIHIWQVSIVPLFIINTFYAGLGLKNYRVSAESGFNYTS